MDWLKWFALLIAVASLQIVAEGAKKKIRIHLPQKVKHIHHHKKIYITNHPATSQYAPSYLKGVKGAVALPSNIARPAVANIIPFHSVELYGESRPRLPGITASASKLLPLYRARGRYGPNQSDVEEQDYDLAPPPEPDSYLPTSYSGNSGASSSSNPSKKIKIVKVNDSPRKKVIRKVKPKRVVVKSRPQPQPQPQPIAEDEHPVSPFHEQFYSDLEDVGTIKKIRKPPRIEKIIDGDTEHIHTYSEEHIHKVVFDDDSKLTGVVGIDNIGSISALTAAHPLVSVKNAQTLLAIPSDSIANFAVVGSMGTPSHLEYASYNPRDVTHDHIFHDHGELPPGVEVTKETLRLPPKVSYDSHGFRIRGEASKNRNNAYASSVKRPSHSYKTSNSPDFSYYETIFSHKHKPKKTYKPTSVTPLQDVTSGTKENSFKPIPAFQFKDNRNKVRNVFSKHETQLIPQFQLQQASVPAPFSVSTTVVHDYAPKNNQLASTSSSSFSKLRDPLVDYKDSYSNDFDYEAFASSSSNVYTTGDKNESASNGKKSVSTQNISFGGEDHQSYVDHLTASASSNSEVSIRENLPNTAESDSFAETTNPATPTPYTIKETSPVHSYYTAMALKALHDEEQEASNADYHYAEAPTLPTYYSEDSTVTTTSSPQFYRVHSTDNITPESDFISETKQFKKSRDKNINFKGDQRNNPTKEYSSSAGPDRSKGRYSEQSSDVHSTRALNLKGNLKYGDKI